MTHKITYCILSFSRELLALRDAYIEIFKLNKLCMYSIMATLGAAMAIQIGGDYSPTLRGADFIKKNRISDIRKSYIIFSIPTIQIY